MLQALAVALCICTPSSQLSLLVRASLKPELKSAAPLPWSAGVTNLYPDTAIEVDGTTAAIQQYYRPLGLTLNDVHFRADSMATCSAACRSLKSRRRMNLCTAWTFARAARLLDAGQCVLLTEPTSKQREAGYFAYGAIWPISKRGSVVGTLDNEPLNVGGGALPLGPGVLE